MKTEITQETVVYSTGEHLRIAREKMGLTQQNVAERLCLKLSMIRDIEENKYPNDIAFTFLRGYICSYARLVHIPENEILSIMADNSVLSESKIKPMHRFSLGKFRKKNYSWMIMIFWLIVCIAIGLMAGWFIEKHVLPNNNISITYKNTDHKKDNKA